MEERAAAKVAGELEQLRDSGVTATALAEHAARAEELTAELESAHDLLRPLKGNVAYAQRDSERISVSISITSFSKYKYAKCHSARYLSTRATFRVSYTRHSRNVSGRTRSTHTICSHYTVRYRLCALRVCLPSSSGVVYVL